MHSSTSLQVSVCFYYDYLGCVYDIRQLCYMVGGGPLQKHLRIDLTGVGGAGVTAATAAPRLPPSPPVVPQSQAPYKESCHHQAKLQ